MCVMLMMSCNACTTLDFGQCNIKEEVVQNAFLSSVIIRGDNNYCSGVFVNNRIYTVAHCVNEDTLEIHFADGSVAEGKVDKKYPERDFATISVKRPEWMPDIYTGRRPRVGQEIFCVGHPGGFTFSYMRGYVMKYTEQILELEAFVFNLPAAPGISGAGIFNCRGEVVGLARTVFSLNPSIGGAIILEEQ